MRGGLEELPPIQQCPYSVHCVRNAGRFGGVAAPQQCPYSVHCVRNAGRFGGVATPPRVPFSYSFTRIWYQVVQGKYCRQGTMIARRTVSRATSGSPWIATSSARYTSPSDEIRQ